MAVGEMALITPVRLVEAFRWTLPPLSDFIGTEAYLMHEFIDGKE